MYNIVYKLMFLKKSIASKDSVSMAEMAVMIERLLRVLDLI